MNITLLKSKIHRVRVTHADLDYDGSISIDPDLLEAAGLLENEQVDVLNVANGSRLTTYTIAGERGSGQIQINGPAAHLVSVGDIVVIVAYFHATEEFAKSYEPKVVKVTENNKVLEVVSRKSACVPST